MENLTAFMTESDQNFIVKPHAEVTDAVVMVADSDKDRCETTEPSPQGYVVVGEMCGLAVMRGAQVFSPGMCLCAMYIHALNSRKSDISYFRHSLHLSTTSQEW